MHATTGADNHVSGARTPSIYFPPGSTTLEICVQIYNCFASEALPLNSWTNVQIAQSKQSNGTSQYSIVINGTEVHSVINSQPQEFQDVKVYASSPWYLAALAEIKMSFYTGKPAHFYET